MKPISLIIFFGVFIPGIVYGLAASDFTVNNQSTYSVPLGSSKVLILDLTLPESLQSIKINNAGTATHLDIARLLIFEDGPSAGWDGDENERVRKSSSPFWDTWLYGDFSKQRIFVTVDIASTAHSGKTIKPEALIDDVTVVGFERMISAEASLPSTPVAPLAGTPEAMSTDTVRWHFIDLSNNEFGFKILDSNLKEVARKEEADISYLDETGLQPNTEYSGRRVVAFNDRGESLGYGLSNFSAVYTLALPEIEPVESPEDIQAGEEVEPQPVEEEPSLLETIQQKIAEIQQKINKLFEQLTELLEQQGAIVWTAFQGFLSSFYEK